MAQETEDAGPLSSLSVIIACRDMADLLAEQLEALAAETWDGDWEVVVVDSASSDHIDEVVARFADQLPSCQLLRADRPGVGHAHQMAADAARGDALLILDADDVIAPGYVATMAKALQCHDLVAARLETAALNPPWLCAARDVPQARGLHPDRGFLPWAQGCALGVRREALDRTGGWPSLRETGDDIWVCWELQRAGAELTFVPDAVVNYRLRQDWRGMLRQALRLGRSTVGDYAQYRHLGVRRPRPWRLPLRWTRLMLQAPLAVASRTWRARWLCDLGLSLGMARQSLRLRVWHP